MSHGKIPFVAVMVLSVVPAGAPAFAEPAGAGRK